MSLELFVWPVQGDELPVVQVEPTKVQLFLYSAVTWNPHRIHYDAEYAQTGEGYDEVLVQGPLLGGWILSTAQEWFRGLGHITSMTHRSVAPAIPGERLLIKGKVSTSTTTTAQLDIEIVDDNGVSVCRGAVDVSKRV